MLDRARTRTLRSVNRGHPASLVAVVVIVLVVLGGAVRPVRELTEPRPVPVAGASSTPAAATTASEFPIRVSIEPGTTFGEVVSDLGEAGVDTDELIRLVQNPAWADLDGTIWETDSLELMLLPGDYLLSTPNPRPLIAEMIDRLRLALDDDLTVAMTEQQLTPTELLRRASVVQAVTSIPAEMPVVAERLSGRRTPQTASVAPTIDAMRAVVWPTSFGVESELESTSGSVSDSPSAAAASVAADHLEQILSTGLEETSGRVALAVGRSGIEAEIEGNAFFETGGLETMAVVYTAETLIQRGDLDPSAFMEVDPSLLARELPEIRHLLRDADIRQALELAIDDGNRTAALSLIEVIGVDRVEDTLRAAGVTRTSLRSRPMVTTAADVLALAVLLDEVVAREGSVLDRFLARRTDSRMEGGFVSRNGMTSFSVTEPGLFHEVARVLDGHRAILVIQLSDGGAGSRTSAVHAAHSAALWVMHYEPGFGQVETRCTFPAIGLGPLDGVSVGLDPGHGGVDSGAVSTVAGRQIRESAVNQAIAVVLKDRLVAEGAHVVMTRCQDEEVSLGARSYILNSSEVDLAVSIHVDAFDDSTVNPSTVVTYSPGASHLARSIAGDRQTALTGVVAGTNSIREVNIRTDPLAVLVMGVSPMVLVEPVSISHPEEAADLMRALDGRSSRIADLATGIAEGILETATSEPRAAPE